MFEHLVMYEEIGSNIFMTLHPIRSKKIPSPLNDAIHRICIENICLKSAKSLVFTSGKNIFLVEIVANGDS